MQTIKRAGIFLWATTLFLVSTPSLLFAQKSQPNDTNFVSYPVDLKRQDLKLYWKDDAGVNFKSILNLKQWLEKHKRHLLFAMNGGMYKADQSPQGLFIENQITKAGLDTSSGAGNFYLKPNGVFYITTGDIPFICNTVSFHNDGHVKYATQSGPMLVIDGEIHPALKPGSPNLNIRNGVGVLPDNRVVFVISKTAVNFYDFADYFKKLGCKNALYLDGFVSRAFLPEKQWFQTDGNFGVIIGVSTNAR